MTVVARCYFCAKPVSLVKGFVEIDITLNRLEGKTYNVLMHAKCAMRIRHWRPVTGEHLVPDRLPSEIK